MSTPDPAPTPTPEEVEAALGFWTRQRLALAWAWQKVRDAGAILRPCRFSVFVVVAGGALLLATTQGRELAVGLPDGGFFGGGLAFHACVLFWAFQSWYWSRLLLDVMFGLDRERDAGGAAYPAHAVWWLRETPRIVAIAAYVVAGVALALAQAWWHLIALAAVGALFYAFLVRPLALTDALHRMFGAAARPIIGAPGQRVYRLRDLPQFSQAVLWASLVLAVLFTAWVIADPVAFGWAFGAAAVPFLGFALIVPVGSLLVYWSHWSGAPAGLLDRRGYPVVTFLVLWAAVVGAVFEHHAVRTTAPAPGAGPAARETLPDVALRWHAQAAKAARSDAPPLVIVATAGGGLRAAYWTATVLGRLQDEAPDFRSYLFGISGVSGGSLGAAVFVTLLADGAPAPTPACGGGKAFECAGQAVLAQDFLAPTAASMLFPDLMQRFVPAPVFPEDRAAALERGWERAWGQAGLAKDAWTRRSFTGLWRGPAGHLPALFLNGTHVETGKRIITASVKIDGAAFRDAYDFFALVSGDVLPSTAAHNSARFPYVSPAGTLRADGTNRGHIVDGGYFENFGATTAAELLHAAIEQLGRRGNTARPVLIQITNDPQLRDDELDVDRLEDPAPRPGNRLGNEILSPPRTLLNTRNARGILAYKAFLRAAPPDRRAHFRLCDVKDLPEPALGWVLAKSSLALMQRIARDDTCGNRAEFERVVKALRR